MIGFVAQDVLLRIHLLQGLGISRFGSQVETKEEVELGCREQTTVNLYISRPCPLGSPFVRSSS
jgi:hypothetical protein